MDFDLSPAQQEFQARAQAFAETHVRPVATQIDEANRFPRELVRQAGAEGLLAVTIPPEWGGAGRDFVSYVLAVEEIGKVSATLAVILVVTNSLVVDLIHQHGTSEQKERWLKRVARGDAVGAFALSEEHAGSDAANQRTVATIADGRFCIDGGKVWVANAEAADVVIVIAATSLRQGERGMTAFLIPMDSPGLTASPTLDSLGVRGLGCRHLTMRRVMADEDAVLAQRDEGFKAALWALDSARVANCGSSAWRGECGTRAGAQSRADAADVRAANRALSRCPVDARRYGHRTRSGTNAHVESGGALSGAAPSVSRGRDGQAAGVRGRASRG